MKGIRIAVPALIVALAPVPGGASRAGAFDSESYVRATVEALCDSKVLEALNPILELVRSIANKKLSTEGYRKWKERHRRHLREVREVVDPLYRRHGIDPDALVAHFGELYEKNIDTMEKLRERVTAGVQKKCPRAPRRGGFEFGLEAFARELVYGYRPDRLRY